MWLLLGVILVSVFTQQSADYPEKGFLQGRVSIGPLCAIEPCNFSAEQVAKFYEARKVVVYDNYTKTKVAGVNLNPKGEYSLSLKPGKYIVDVTDGKGNEMSIDDYLLGFRSRYGIAFPRQAEIKAGVTSIVDFDIDTGLRAAITR
ncbi:MAG: hypothetical protein HY051_01860 [Candidatus Aenigmarchaeota archaeon]|nr:hypothetical protein [Candidatus Aenigmarchaeota archaeon]